MADDQDHAARPPDAHDRGDGGGEQREPPAPRTVPFTQQVGRIALVVVAVLFVAFTSINVQPVDFHWIFGGTEVVRQGGEYVRGGVPLIVLLLGSFAVGALLGAGLVWWRHRRRTRVADPAGAGRRRPPERRGA
ncbi:MAG TPA: LapA family protein [Nitriliruptorales bacterium]|nr:LapA family protein [Nitriliruptorales bacterium]